MLSGKKVYAMHGCGMSVILALKCEAGRLSWVPFWVETEGMLHETTNKSNKQSNYVIYKKKTLEGNNSTLIIVINML